MTQVWITASGRFGLRAAGLMCTGKNRMMAVTLEDRDRQNPFTSGPVPVSGILFPIFRRHRP